MIRAILYDLDGVLVDACEWHYESLNRALKDVCGFEINRQDHITKFNGLPTKIKLNMLQDEGVMTAEDASNVFRLKQKYTIEVINQFANPYLEKVELHKFTQSMRIRSACVTNCIRETATLMLSKTWQFDYMNSIICNEDAKPKPSPDPYILAMKRLCVYPNECIIIEDSEKGLQSASATGAQVVKVDGCFQVNKGLIEQMVGGR